MRLHPASLRVSFLLCILTVCMGGGCTRIPLADDARAERPLSLALSLKNVVPFQEAPQTRMTQDVTQSGGVFRGISQMYIIPFQTESSRVEPEDSRLGNENVVLGSVGIGRNGLISNNNAHYYGSAFVPNGMNHVLAYGKAPDEGDNASKDSKHAYGVLTPDGVLNPSGSGDIAFHLEPVLVRSEETDEYSDVIAMADALLDQLNVVMSLMQHSEYASVVGIFDAVKREYQILACSYPTLDQIRTEIQTALLRIPFESMALIEEISRISSALNSFSTVLSSAGSAYPASYGIPEGSIGFWWNGEAFVRLFNGVNIALVDPASYCYPPGLWYYANSAVKTSNDETIRSQYVSANEQWDYILAHYTDGQTVNSLTQSVAIADQLQYGVGLLELILDAPGEEVASLINGSPLTGVIIGDQKDVDFRFLPAPGQSRAIYDNKTGNPRLGVAGGAVQTLVLQTQDNAPVHFVLEFRNNTGYTRRCQQGDILPWCKFYLAGVLDPASGVPQLPGETLNSVFSRDHKTTVTVRVESLRNAYNTVPDMHDPQLEIGVVAEMKWAQITPSSVKLEF